MDSTQRVQFDEYNDPITAHTLGSVQNRWRKQRKGLIEFFVAKGYAKNETEASNILLAITITLVLFAVGFSAIFGYKAPVASLELQRTTQWNNDGNRGLPPPDYRPTLKQK